MNVRQSTPLRQTDDIRGQPSAVWIDMLGRRHDLPLADGSPASRVHVPVNGADARPVYATGTRLGAPAAIRSLRSRGAGVEPYGAVPLAGPRSPRGRRWSPRHKSARSSA